jgi:superfamily II DNA or RNA helicase
MSTIILRDYQISLYQAIHAAWVAKNRNVMAVLPTGGGKTVLFSNVVYNHPGASCTIAHRQELVSQISLSLAKFGTQHSIIGPEKLIKHIISLHIEYTGHNFYNPSSKHAVAGVDTLIRRKHQLRHWCPKVTLWVQDEGHHLLRDNKWGKAVAMFPNAKGLSVTATPCRADGKGLGYSADGLIHTMVQGPGMRQLIEMGYLSDYIIFTPQTDIDLSQVAVSKATGDFNPQQLKQQIKKSRIVGDVVNHYMENTPGKLGVTFSDNVETATDISNRFNQVGVPSMVVTAKTPDRERFNAVRKFARREVLQLVNVDIFGEGFDLPALEVISMARPTESYNLYCQQFGRALRIMEGKERAIINDHVGNWLRHGLPDASRVWSLDRAERRTNGKDPDLIPVKNCNRCTAVYEAIYKCCPYCGHINAIQERSGPEHVDGDLMELSPEILEAMRGEVARIDESPEALRRRMSLAGAPGIVAAGAAKQHRLRQEAQAILRKAILQWAGMRRLEGRPDDESYRRFYHTFGVDVLTAQTYGRRKAEELTKIIGGTL